MLVTLLSFLSVLIKICSEIWAWIHIFLKSFLHWILREIPHMKGKKEEMWSLAENWIIISVISFRKPRELRLTTSKDKLFYTLEARYKYLKLVGCLDEDAPSSFLSLNLIPFQELAWRHCLFLLGRIRTRPKLSAQCFITDLYFLMLRVPIEMISCHCSLFSSFRVLSLRRGQQKSDNLYKNTLLCYCLR